MMVITGFMARRSKPHIVISDNGTNFLGAAREFKERFSQWDRDAMCKQLSRGQIVWKFNRPGAPILVKFGRDWCAVVRKPCLRSLEIDV